jgi:hypothetical protein
LQRLAPGRERAAGRTIKSAMIARAANEKESKASAAR